MGSECEECGYEDGHAMGCSRDPLNQDDELDDSDEDTDDSGY
jgi:hypothetical protein